MYAVKVILLPSPDPAFPDAPGPPSDMPGDQRLDAIAQHTRTVPQPGIAHVSLARWGRSLIAMTFVEAGGPEEAMARARHGWNRWLGSGLLPDWVIGGCRPDRYLSGPTYSWHETAMSASGHPEANDRDMNATE
ncbi:hypothetical protein [Streptomyces sp. NPDC046909]|uniref:hypothetical protein n=1 Tax=Streptomyces sp. NPDC046909 TaxID=3155617 RepID=UPI0033D7F0CD